MLIWVFGYRAFDLNEWDGLQLDAHTEITCVGSKGSRGRPN